MTATARRLAPLPAMGSEPTWEQATEAFLRRDLAPKTRPIYRLTLDKVASHLWDDCALATVTAPQLAQALHAAYPDAAPASWNRHVATLRSFTAFARRQGWLDHDPTTALEGRRVLEDHSRALSRDDLDRLFARREVAVRDRCLWRMLYETAARTNEVLSLNVEDLDLADRRAATISKGGNTDVIHWATGTARLLPKVIEGRTKGPVFLAERAPSPSRAPALTDLDPTTGRARLSYRRAAEIFSQASDGSTLHHLRHSALTHLAEDGVPTVLLMAKSRHSSLRTLQRYARPGVEAVARLTAEHDPARRR
jgi:integrase